MPYQYPLTDHDLGYQPGTVWIFFSASHVSTFICLLFLKSEISGSIPLTLELGSKFTLVSVCGEKMCSHFPSTSPWFLPPILAVFSLQILYNVVWWMELISQTPHHCERNSTEMGFDSSAISLHRVDFSSQGKGKDVPILHLKLNLFFFLFSFFYQPLFLTFWEHPTSLLLQWSCNKKLLLTGVRDWN